MATDAIEVRLARLEGSYEQIDKRLTSLEATVVELRKELGGEMATLRSELRGELVGLRNELSQRLDALSVQLMATIRWGAILILSSWVTIMLAVIGLYFRR